MKNRIKLTTPAIKTRAEAELALNDIALITLARNKAMLAMDTEIAQIRERYEAAINECNKSLEEKTDLVRNWAEANQEEFKGLKSLDLFHAVIGWRTGQPTLKTLAGWTWDRVLEKLKTYREGLNYIRTKEEVNRQTLLVDRESLGEDKLRAIGLRVVQQESFFIEPKLSTLETRQQSAA